MSVESLDVSVGARLWYQGGAWTVVELDGATLMLRSGDGFRRIHAPSLVGLAQPLEDSAPGDAPLAELDAVVLAGLTTAQRRYIEAEAQVVEELVLAPGPSFAVRELGRSQSSSTGWAGRQPPGARNGRVRGTPSSGRDVPRQSRS